MAFVIALVGAQGSGRSTLAQALAQGLQQAGLGPVARSLQWPSDPPDPPADWLLLEGLTPSDLADVPCAEGDRLVLLMGLDRPSAVQQTQDRQWRQALLQQAVPHQTVYGQAQERTHAAWLALASHLGVGHWAHDALQTIANHSGGKSAERLKSLQFKPVCENCGSAECEHRLFRRLIAGRH